MTAYREPRPASRLPAGFVASSKSVEKLAAPEQPTRFHALGVLREFARRSFEDCAGFAFSPQHAECLEYCGIKPIGVPPRRNEHGLIVASRREGYEMLGHAGYCDDHAGGEFC